MQEKHSTISSTSEFQNFKLQEYVNWFLIDRSVTLLVEVISIEKLSYSVMAFQNSCFSMELFFHRHNKTPRNDLIIKVDSPLRLLKAWPRIFGQQGHSTFFLFLGFIFYYWRPQSSVYLLGRRLKDALSLTNIAPSQICTSSHFL